MQSWHDIESKVWQGWYGMDACMQKQNRRWHMDSYMHRNSHDKVKVVPHGRLQKGKVLHLGHYTLLP